MRPVARLASFVVFSILAVPAFAGFQSTVEYLVAVGRVAGQGGAQFYTTIWATNLTNSPVSFKLDFLKQGQANPSPASFSDTLAAGQTKTYENVVETKLGLTNAIGAARITATGKILVSERIYNQAPGTDIGNTEGLFFAGVPASFSISGGQSASIQGINQGGSENFRYNFAMIETGGGSPTANVQVFDGNGTLLGQKSYPLLPYEQIQPNVADVVAGVSTTNARITATVTGGTGSLILAGAQLANVSQDSSGFEMSFPDNLIGAGSSGLSAVTHDASLTGAGTGASPLGIANGQVVRSLNGLHDAVTLAAGSNVTLTPSGSTITIAASGSGSGGGLTLPYSGTGTSGSALFSVTNTNNVGVYGQSGGSRGVWGEGGAFGVYGDGTQGVHGVGTDDGVYGTGPTGIYGQGGSTSSGKGVYGTGYVGVYGDGTWEGVNGITASGVAGVHGSGGNVGVAGDGVTGVAGTGTSYGVYSYGNFGGTGAKYFVEPHPTDPEKEIRFVCLEGPESGTYFRGTSHIVGGFATIEIPESFRMVTAEKGLTVVVTPVGDPAMLYCVRRSLDQILIKGSADVEFDYVVNGVRKAFEDHEAISENRDFVPRSASDPRFTTGLPAESIRRLIATGILNADGSISLETAHRLGWDQRESWKREETERDQVAVTPR